MQKDVGASAQIAFDVGLISAGATLGAPRKPRRSIQKTVLRVFVLHHEAQLHLQFLRPADQREHFFRLLRKLFEFRAQAVQRLIQSAEIRRRFLPEIRGESRRRSVLRLAGSSEKNSCERSRTDWIAPDICGV